MRNTLNLTVLTAALLAGSAIAAAAQTNPSASQLINALKPSGTLSDTTRGIKPLPPGPAGSMAPAPAPMATPAAMNTPAPMQEPAHAAPSANLHVDFASGSSVLTPHAMSTLDELGKALTSTQLASYNFKIAGHTDTVGDANTNQTLSQARADAVKSYLESKFQISDSRLQSVGLGENDLLVSTPLNTPSQANRRVEVINLGQ